MSYCRFGEADVYIYDDVYHGIICCLCSLIDVEDDSERYGHNFVAGYDRQKMLDHIEDHRNAGHNIPYDVDLRLRKEMKHVESCPCNNADERGCFLISAETNKCVSCECENNE